MTRAAEAADRTLAYDVAGPAGAPPIVFAHGVRVTRKQWLPQMRTLSDTYRVIALDLPGHGALSDVHFSLEAASATLGRVIDAAAGGRALVVGLSLGGYVAIDLAAQRPQAVAGLVLTGCSANPAGLVRAVPATLALFTRLVGDRWLRVVDQVSFRLRYGDELAREQLEAGLFFQGMQQALWDLQGHDFRKQIRQYHGPVLLLNGERDGLYRLGELLFLAAAPDARLQLVRRAGHVANLEQPERYDRAVRSFARCVDW